MIRINLVDPTAVAVSIAVLPRVVPVETVETAATPAEADQPAAVPMPMLRMRCRYKGPNTVAEWLASFQTRTTADVIAEIVESWSGVGATEHEQPVPVSRLTVACLLDQIKPVDHDKTMFMAIVDAYLTALSEAAAKN